MKWIRIGIRMGNALEKLQEGAQLLADLHHVFNDTHKTRGKVFCIWIRSLTKWGLLMKNCYTFTLISILYLVVFVIVINYLLFPILHGTIDQRAFDASLFKYAAYQFPKALLFGSGSVVEKPIVRWSS
jgi:hypothetical protein